MGRSNSRKKNVRRDAKGPKADDDGAPSSSSAPAEPSLNGSGAGTVDVESAEGKKTTTSAPSSKDLLLLDDDDDGGKEDAGDAAEGGDAAAPAAGQDEDEDDDYRRGESGRRSRGGKGGKGAKKEMMAREVPPSSSSPDERENDPVATDGPRAEKVAGTATAAPDDNAAAASGENDDKYANEANETKDPSSRESSAAVESTAATTTSTAQKMNKGATIDEENASGDDLRETVAAADKERRGRRHSESDASRRYSADGATMRGVGGGRGGGGRISSGDGNARSGGGGGRGGTEDAARGRHQRRSTVGNVELDGVHIQMAASASVTPEHSPLASSKAVGMTPSFLRRLATMGDTGGGVSKLQRSRSMPGAGLGGRGVAGGGDEIRTAKKKAKKMRKRLKRLVHATNTMGAAVSAKEQTTTQLALCMQLGLTLGLRHQRPAANISESDAALAAGNDQPLVLQVGSKAVEDGSHLPAFRFIVHAPSRFERVRAAWGLSLQAYTDSFGLDPDIVNAIASHELLGRGLAEDTAEDDIRRVVSSKEVTPPVDDAEASEYASASSSPVGEKTGAGAAGAAAGDGGGKSHVEEDGGGDFSDFSGGEGAGSGYESDGKMGTSKLLPSTTSLRVISTSDASGKSSSWFFCSDDSRFLVKTCTSAEMNVLLNILGEYGAYATENRHTSMLPQYYGLYTIEVGSRSAHFIIMNYWFATMHEIGVRYDLKGSTKGRRAGAKEKAKGPAAVLKDLDFLENEDHKVESKLAAQVKRAIEKDVQFLEDNRLIDYSMMLGLHFRDADGVAGGEDGSVYRGNVLQHAFSAGAVRETHTNDPGHSRQESDVTDENSIMLNFDLSSPGGGGGGGGLSSNGGGEASQPPSPIFASGGSNRGGPFKSVRGGPFSMGSLIQEGNRIFQLRALETPTGLAYLGIIDILTEYTAVKKFENCCFGKMFCGADISCQPPDVYAHRFKKFIDLMLMEPKEEKKKKREEEEEEEEEAGKGEEETTEKKKKGDDGNEEASSLGPREGAAARSLEIELAAVAK